ncbi:MAG: sigma-70 family RNA polymerase sigma factor [Pirellulales bacterium]|nr:sigma-70 family RNA polymerase sigma factor [Pirellulales bacterium]
MPPAVNDDLELVHRAQRGDFSAFEVLLGHYETRIYRLAYRILRREHDAEEVVQQTFLSVIEHLASFREESRFSTWLLKIAANHALAVLRKKRREHTVAWETPPEEEGYQDVPHPRYIAQWRDTPEELAGRRETRHLLDEALEELDDKYRLVFVLRDIEGLSTQETAEALDISVANVKVRLLRARLMLREKLTRAFGDEATRVEPHDHDH